MTMMFALKSIKIDYSYIDSRKMGKSDMAELV